MQLIEDINSEIKRLFGLSFPRKTILISGLAEPIIVKEDEKSELEYPAIIDYDGECVDVLQDDRYALGVYHKLLGKSYTQEKGFGDAQSDYCTYEIQLICWGFRDKLRKTSQFIEETIIIPSLPVLVIPTSSDFNSQKVMQSEFKMPVEPGQFIFSTKYKFKVRAACRK